MNCIIILVILLILCLCYLCYPSIKEGHADMSPPKSSSPPNKNLETLDHVNNESGSESSAENVQKKTNCSSGIDWVCPTATHNPKTANEKGILFLYPEVNGFNVQDFGGFPDGPTVAANFKGIAVIANHASKNFAAQWSDPKVLALAKAAGNIPIYKWMAYYFGNDSWACECAGPRGKALLPGGATNPNYWPGGCCTYYEKPKEHCGLPVLAGRQWSCSACSQKVLAKISSDVCKYNLNGILFDDEVGDATCIVQAMENAQENISTPCGRLQLGWTLSLGSAKKTSPGGLSTNSSAIWDICLGQAYTDNTTDLYNGSCNFSPDFWPRVASRFDQTVSATRGVPMVCGSGCGIKDDNICIDQRMNGAQISKLLQKRPAASAFKWRNFAIWYGTYSNPSFGCKNSDSACETECCTNWTK